MTDSKNTNLDAFFNTSAAALGAAYQTACAAQKGIQDVQNAWNQNNSDSRRNMGGCAPQSTAYSVPMTCPYPYADNGYYPQPGYGFNNPTYTMQQPIGYYGFTDQSYGFSAGPASMPSPFGFNNNGGNTPNGSWWY